MSEYTRTSPFLELKPRKVEPIVMASIIIGILVILFVGGIVVLIVGAGIKSSEVKVIGGSLMGASVFMYLVLLLAGYTDKRYTDKKNNKKNNKKSKLQRISRPLMESSKTLPNEPYLRYAVQNSTSVRNLWTTYLKTNDPALKKRWLEGTKREADKFYNTI